MNLKNLINKYGKPDVLIDNHSNPHNKGIAIWGVSEFLIYDSKGINKNNQYIEADPLDILDSTISDWQDDANEISTVGYISYDFKNYLYVHINFKDIISIPYFWFIKPKQIFYYNLQSFSDIDVRPCMSLKQDILDIASYEKKINLIKQELIDGNAYQVNFTMEKKYNIDIDPFDLYLMIRKVSVPEYGYYLNMGDKQILSFSPEQFFNIENNIIKSYPMKGTQARSQNLIEDNILKAALLNSEKDKAEHLMIVDLIRNDLGKISEFGSVDVEKLFNVNSYETVYQMVSSVSGKIVKNSKFSHMIKSLCPGGSITGAPKESAMKIIDRLENYNRGIYTGSIGYIKNNNDMNFNIAIRTMLIDNSIGHYSVGGGIVWDSNYKDEWNEAQLKSKILDQCII